MFAGRLVPEKGLLTLLMALPHARGHSLDVFGEARNPTYLQEVTRLIQELNLEGRVTLRGRVDRQVLLEHYQSYDALVLPSEWDEPLSITMLEAMAAGLPVIATRRGGSPEVIDHQRNGLLYEPSDYMNLAAAISQLEDADFASAMGAEARKSVLSEFGIGVMVGEVEKILIDALPKGGLTDCGVADDG